MMHTDGQKKSVGSAALIALVIIVMAGIALTALRLYVGCRIPMFLRGEFVADDVLMMRYADSLMKGEWLGAYRGATLTKVAGYPVFVALLSKLNIPYVTGITFFYCFCVLIFCIAVYKLYPNVYVIFALYVFLLFTPIMFNRDSVQQAYRAGFLASMTLLLLASVIGLFGTILRKQHAARTAGWSLMTCISLVWFWFTKEDGIWIMPFLICGLLISAWLLFFGDKSGKTGKYRTACAVFLVLPLVCLGLSTLAVRAVNKYHYGVFAITDRNETYYSKVISDLFHIDDGEQSLIVWLRRPGLENALDVSPTLAENRAYFDMLYSGSWAVGKDGEMHGDGLYWALREAVEFNGVYEKGGAAVNEYYRKIHEELTAAFENGTLPKDTESLYLSSGGRGMTWKEICDYFPGGMRRIIAQMLRYSFNDTAATPATGPEENIQMMAEILKNPYVFADGSNADAFSGPVSFAMGVTACYTALGIWLTVAAFVGYLFFGIAMIAGFFRKNYDRVPLMIVSVGMGLSALMYTFCVLWFCAWHTLELAYQYLGGVILIINVLQIVGVSLLVCETVKLVGFVRQRSRRSPESDS